MDRGITVDGKRSKLVLGQSGKKIRVSHTVQIDLEQSVQSLAQSMGQDRSRSLSPEAAEQGIAQATARHGISFEGEVGAQQRNALEAFTQGPALVYLEGVAGTGKTKAVLPACVEAWTLDQRRVIGLCQAWRQTDDLSEAGITERHAITPFLARLKDGGITVDGNTVLVVDEAAQVSPRQFVELQRLWMEHGTVVRAMGDRLQCQAIEAGSAAELIARPTILPEYALPTIRETVRQSTPEQRELATTFRNGDAASAIDVKRANGTARLVGGDYDQVVQRIADRYLQLRDMADEQRWSKGVMVYTLTNQDAAEISKSVRYRLKARGEIAQQETVYQAIDNRGVHYDLPVAIGDKHRLFKRVFGTVNGRLQPVGNNGDVVEILDHGPDGLKIRTKPVTSPTCAGPASRISTPTGSRWATAIASRSMPPRASQRR